MLPVHALLFDHALESLKEYQSRGRQEKDILVKDAQVAMSCVLNTTLKRACRHFGELDEADLVETAKSLSVIDGFEKHECTIITRNDTIPSENGCLQLWTSIFSVTGLEIANIEFKRPGSTERDLALQNRKNVRLARCIQEAHFALSVEDASGMMADVVGT
ncbi:hypothetical protein BGZ97_013379 [Linnemannia gamsii]|uniref:Uncharacterized protein n=1 Tax=Linnemannia gamsii TaxID=64522 RepID=A0A9P6UKF8_9FUNG|nr:hypothetical protein BGZ97_013379 [Linnemannia gamsii]